MALWWVVAAAGAGARMHSAVPKQYLTVLGKTVFECTLQRLLAVKECAGMVIAVADGDSLAPTLVPETVRCIWSTGKDSRAGTVLAALDALMPYAQPEDWVLVHDVARPCVRVEDIQKLIAACMSDPWKSGGLLAVPVVDTLKLSGTGKQVEATVDRSMLWSALTPQMFPLSVLRHALTTALEQGREIRDEASALEVFGHQPLLIPGRRDNIKLTYPEDLPMVECILQQQLREE